MKRLLKKLSEFDMRPEEGEIYRDGKDACVLTKAGYNVVNIGKTQYTRAVLIYLYVNGFLPGKIGMQLFHMDGDKSNDRIDNLVPVTINFHRYLDRRPNESGEKLVHRIVGCKKYSLIYSKNGKRFFERGFRTVKDAVKVRNRIVPREKWDYDYALKKARRMEKKLIKAHSPGGR